MLKTAIEADSPNFHWCFASKTNSSLCKFTKTLLKHDLSTIYTNRTTLNSTMEWKAPNWFGSHRIEGDIAGRYLLSCGFVFVISTYYCLLAVKKSQLGLPGSAEKILLLFLELHVKILKMPPLPHSNYSNTIKLKSTSGNSMKVANF